MKNLVFASCLVVLPMVGVGQKATSVAEGWRERIAMMRAKFPGDMAVFAKHLGTGETLAIDADTVYETFSVIKVPIMAEVLRQAEEGRFALTDRLPYRAQDARLPSGVLYAFDPGLQPTIKDLLHLMIMISDNSATDMLADKVGRDRVTRYMQRLGLPKTRIKFSDLDWDRRWLGTLDKQYLNVTGDKTITFPFEKYPSDRVSDAFRRVVYETEMFFGHSTAREMGRLFELIARRELVSKRASDLMIEILKKQQVNNRIPRYLDDVTVAHKTGDGQPWIGNDAGILWIAGQPVVLVVFTGRHRGDTASLHDAVARVAAIIADHYGAKVDPAGLR
jgi:beta-lactamase class A